MLFLSTLPIYFCTTKLIFLIAQIVESDVLIIFLRGCNLHALGLLKLCSCKICRKNYASKSLPIFPWQKCLMLCILQVIFFFGRWGSVPSLKKGVKTYLPFFEWCNAIFQDFFSNHDLAANNGYSLTKITVLTHFAALAMHKSFQLGMVTCCCCKNLCQKYS